MEREIRTGTADVPYDYRKYDKIWQRVAPSLNPYPGGESAEESGEAPASPNAVQPVQTVQTAQTVQAEENLPGAAANPCCMGSAAQDDLEVLEGFIEGELSDRRYYLAFARQAPASARQTLWRIAGDEENHARRLMTAYYLITARCYRPSVSCDRVYIGAYCPALRERYHEEICGWMNYLRAAEGTTDPCLQRLFRELAAEESGHADALTRLLRQALGRPCDSGRMGV